MMMITTVLLMPKWHHHIEWCHLGNMNCIGEHKYGWESVGEWRTYENKQYELIF